MLLTSRAVALVLVVAGLGVTPHAQAAPAPVGAARPGKLSVVPSARIPGEKVTVSARVPGGIARPVRLEGRIGGAWKKLAAKSSQPSGRVSFTTTNGAATAVRLVAPQVRRGKKGYDSWKAHSDLGRLTQGVVLTMPATLTAGQTAHASVKGTPFRKGRTVHLQVFGAHGDPTWTDVAPSDPGRTTISLFAWVAEDGLKYRALLSPYRGARQVVSATRTVEVVPAGGIVKVSQKAGGGESDSGGGEIPSVSADGRYVAFQSGASDLGPVDTNNRVDIYVRDQQTGVSTRASTGPGQTSGSFPDISADGDWVVFHSEDQLVAADTNGSTFDVYLWHRTTGALILVSHGPAGHGGLSSSWYATVSADGNLVAYETSAQDIIGDAAPEENVVVWNRATGTTHLVSRPAAGGDPWANGFSNRPDIAADGSAVAFESTADNLLGVDSGSVGDNIFLQPLSGGAPSSAPRLVTHVPGAVSTAANDDSDLPTVSDDGRYVAYQSNATDLQGTDQNLSGDIFVWDATTGANTRVTNPQTDTSLSRNPAISGDGSTIAFESTTPDFVTLPTVRKEVYRWRRSTGAIDLVSRPGTGGQADAESREPAVGATGGFVVFTSAAHDLAGTDVQPYPDVFLFTG